MTDKESKDLQVTPKQEVTSPAEQTRPGLVFTPNVDIFETDDEITLLADMPGVSADNLTIDLRESTLTLTVEVAPFEGANEVHVNKKPGKPRRHEEDVDDDGDTDLVFHFLMGDTNLTCVSTEGTLTGELFDGLSIEGTDAVRMVNSRIELKAMDDEVTTPVDTSVTIDVLANDIYDAAVVVSVQVFPQFGILEIEDVGLFVYTPNAGFVGIDSFIYQICDNLSLCDTATVTITVGP